MHGRHGSCTCGVYVCVNNPVACEITWCLLTCVMCIWTLPQVSIEELVLRDGLVMPRLRSTLLRILTAEGSRYKPQVRGLGNTHS